MFSGSAQSLELKDYTNFKMKLFLPVSFLFASYCSSLKCHEGRGGCGEEYVR